MRRPLWWPLNILFSSLYLISILFLLLTLIPKTNMFMFKTEFIGNASIGDFKGVKEIRVSFAAFSLTTTNFVSSSRI